MNVLKGGDRKPPRIVIYGAPKVGKTKFAAGAPLPIFVTTEDGASSLSVDQFPVARTWQEFMGNLVDVSDGKHEYRTLVVDTLNGAANLCAEYICKTQFKGDWGPNGFLSYGRGWASASDEFKQILTPLEMAREHGMMVILIGHTGVHSVKNPVEGDYDRYALGIDRKLWARIHPWADIIMRADYDYVVQQKEGLAGRGRAIGDSKRVLRCEGSAAEDAGCRVGYELPPVLPLDWAAFELALGGTESIADEVKNRWGLLSEQEQAGTLKFLGVRALEEITRANQKKVLEVVERLRKRETKNG